MRKRSRPPFIRLHFAVATVALALTGCAGFSGRVVTPAGEPVAGARVDVALHTDTTDADGRFGVRVGETPRLVMTIEKDGYASLSRIYRGQLRDGEWTLTRAARRLVDPSRPIVVEDPGGAATCSAPLRNRIDWTRFPGPREQRFNHGDGTIREGPYPEALQRAVDRVATGAPYAAGMSVRIPAGAFVDGDGKSPRGEVAVSVAAIDPFAPDGMPGDFTVADPAQDHLTATRFLEAFAAGSVTATADGHPQQLAPLAEATIALAVDPDTLVIKGAIEGARLPETLPLLAYDLRRGVWHTAGTASLDDTQGAYVATVTRLGIYAVGRIHGNPTCVAFDAGAIDGNFDLEVTAPFGNTVAVRTATFANRRRNTIHVLANLPADTDIELRGYKGGDRNRCPVTAGHGVNTGPPRSTDACRQQQTVKLVGVPPGPPTLSAEGSPDGSVALNWGFHWCSIYSAAGFDGYRLQESRTSPERDFYEIRQFSGGAEAITAFTVLGTPPGTIWYRVGAFRGGRLTEHGWSDPLMVRIGGP